MRLTALLLTVTLLGIGSGGAVHAADPDSPGLATALAKALAARRTAAAIHTTDFQGTDIGCIVLPRRELRPYGYPGHAFLCEVADTGEVLGAVVTAKGFRRCTIAGTYEGDACYRFDICGRPERLCVF